jgi:hypothetical protein
LRFHSGLLGEGQSPEIRAPRRRSRRDNRSLPATIFHHFFQKLPQDEAGNFEWMSRGDVTIIESANDFDRAQTTAGSTEVTAVGN